MKTTRTLGIAAVTLALTLGGVAGTATSASAAPRVFANCTAVHQVYSGGIAKKSVTQNKVTSGGKTSYRALKGTVKKDDALYRANKKMDRDADGIACEKS
ncbi:hypothetical protein E9228_002582 [Curtobacterium flaccumfaciens]|uniref:Excalibur calcium-binding domain-containing protein n=1 Tax=Curtobacterium salicis TaxID=1779862 RepID=A0ABX0TAA4_9MICO|nr:hypothetical protein [Curtobacterium sp. WW7]